MLHGAPRQAASMALGQLSSGAALAAPAALTGSLVRQVATKVAAAESRGSTPVVLCATRMRPALRRMLKPSLPRLPVVAAAEVVPSLRLETVGSVTDGTVVAA